MYKGETVGFWGLLGVVAGVSLLVTIGAAALLAITGDLIPEGLWHAMIVSGAVVLLAVVCAVLSGPTE